MPDLPVTLSRPELRERLVAAVDRDGKIAQAIADLGPVADRDILLVGGAAPRRTQEIAEAGGRVTTVPLRDLNGVPPASADVVVAPWAGFVAGDDRFDAQVSAAGRAARPGGRLLVVQDYGRDDVRPLVGAPTGMSARARDRDDWFLRRGFKVRVLHCWWTFESVDAARAFLPEAFPGAGETVAASLTRERLAHKVVVYHRDL